MKGAGIMSEQNITVAEFRDYIRSKTNRHFELSEPDENNFILETEYACGQIVIHPMEIIELMITNKADGTNQFYLHFQLKDRDHAHDLLNEMIRTLISLKDEQKTRILLTCSSALTTSFFAEKLNEAARSLQLDYTFDAVSINMIYDEGFDYDVILLAPQVGYEYKRMKEIFKKQLVIKLPADLFARYNTGGVFRLIVEQMKEKEMTKEPELKVALRSAFDNSYRILSIVMINHKNLYRFGYRIFDHGKKTLDKEVIKPTQSFQDIEDLFDYVLVRHKNIDAIALALPGVIYRGNIYNPETGFSVRRNIGIYLSEKYGKPVFLINDVNAIALGYYAVNENSENMVFHFQPRGMAASGTGIIIDGKLYRGRRSAAGETGVLIKAVVENADDRIMSPEGAMEIVGKSVLAYATLLAPEKVVIYSDLTPDMQALREYVAQFWTDEYIPELIHVNSLKEYMLTGAMIHALELLNKDEKSYRTYVGMDNAPDNWTFGELLKKAKK